MVRNYTFSVGLNVCFGFLSADLLLLQVLDLRNFETGEHALVRYLCFMFCTFPFTFIWTIHVNSIASIVNIIRYTNWCFRRPFRFETNNSRTKERKFRTSIMYDAELTMTNLLTGCVGWHTYCTSLATHRYAYQGNAYASFVFCSICTSVMIP